MGFCGETELTALALKQAGCTNAEISRILHCSNQSAGRWANTARYQLETVKEFWNVGSSKNLKKPITANMFGEPIRSSPDRVFLKNKDRPIYKEYTSIWESYRTRWEKENEKVVTESLRGDMM
jgi:transcriptional regulator